MGKKVLTTSMIAKILGMLVLILSGLCLTQTLAYGETVQNYKIVNSGGQTIEVTIEHKNAETGEAIYSPDIKQLTVGASINDYKKAVNWEVASVDVTPEGQTTTTLTSADDWQVIALETNATITIKYTETDTTFTGETTFYDYNKSPYSGYASINADSNYTSDQPRLTMGTSANGASINGKYINVYTSGTSEAAYKEDIIQNLTGDNYQTVNFNDAIAAPDLFSDDTTNTVGKTVYKNYALQFSQTGDTYDLTEVLDTSDDNRVVWDKDNDTQSNGIWDGFYPLNDAESSTQDDDESTSKNYYFGMRYDVNFTLGDYVGDLTYHFNGDDDLWVCLDGEVIIDLGGIHDSLDDTINLWDALGIVQGEATTEQKVETHTLTVLYMERGAGKSHCQMDFTIPNAQIVDVTEVPQANIDLTKTNSDGAVLEGATFKLTNDETGSIVYTKTSDNSGKVAFSNLKAGDYTLTETSAPTGYTASEETWTVEVRNNDDGTTATAVVKNAADETLETQADGSYQMINYTPGELLDKNLVYDKTATLTSWEDRTYDIEITAASKVTETTTQEGNADIMLVLDRSGSMGDLLSSGFSEIGAYQEVKAILDQDTTYYYGASHRKMKYKDGQWQYRTNKRWTTIVDTDTTIIYQDDLTRMDALKNAANSFLTNIASNTPESKVGIASYASTGYVGSTLNQAITPIGSDASGFISAINTLTAFGGTSPELGLNLANTELTRVKDQNPQYVILFTDGEPTGNSPWLESWESQAATETAVAALKANGVTVYTVGLGLTEEAKTWLSGSIASSPSQALTGDTAEDLNDIFDQIQQEITENEAITGATITDTIDARFELTAAEATRLTQDGASVQNNADGTTTVTWTGQTLPYQTKADGSADQWEKTIHVVAKESYIGGNDVPTNVAGSSSIQTSIGNASLPQPTVNVKADFAINASEDTLFWGDTLHSTLSEERLEAMTTIQSTTGEDYTNLDDVAFTFTWFSDEACTQAVDLETLKMSSPEADQIYYMQATMTPKTDGTVSQDNSNNYVVQTEKKTATYTVHVVKGQLEITKTIDQQYSSIAQINANQTFVFKVEYYGFTTNESGDYQKGGLVNTFYVPINFDANSEVNTKSEIISGLKKGYYTVTEESAWSDKYTQNVVIDNANNTTEGVDLFIGEKTTDADWTTSPVTKPSFYGLEVLDRTGEVTSKYQAYATSSVEKTPAVLTVTNNIQDGWQWLSDSALAMNQFRQ